MNLLVITIEKFQEIEMHGFIGTLKRSKKIEKITYWNPDNLNKVAGSNEIGYIETINNEININDYDAIFVPGGASCINLRKNKKALDLIEKFFNANKWVFAICDAPNALFETKIITNQNYSSYPIAKDMKQISGVNRKEDYVVVDNKLITGRGPSASVDLAIKVIEIIYGNELSKQIYNEVYAISK